MSLSGSLTAGYWYDDYGKSRGYTLSWSAEQSIAENKSTIRWSVSTAGTYAYEVAERTLSVTLAGQTLIDKTDRVMRGAGVVASGSFDVAHDVNGNLSISASIRAAVYYSTVNCSNSGSWSLNQIPRQANISSAPDFNDEENPTILYSNPAGNAVSSLDACISLTGSRDDIPYRDISKTGNSYTFYLTDAERETLRNACTTANRRNVTFFVRTEIGGTTFYSTLTKTLSIVNANPVITEANAEDIKESTVAVTLDNQKAVKGCSEIEVSMSASALKGATIEKYRIKNGNAEINSRSGSFLNAESGVFLFSVTDSRGNATEQTVELPLIDYVKLTCNMNEKAPNAEGNVSFTITGNCFAGTFGEVENEVHVYLQYAENGGEFSDWVEYETILGMDNRYVTEVSMTGLNYQSSFTFRAMARDLLSEVESPQKTVRTVPIFDWGEKDFNFNVPVLIQGHALDDYVVEQGIDGIWTYKKWKSGIAECFGLHSITAGSTGNIAATVDYPFEWDSSNGYPIVLLTPGYNSTLYSHVKNCDAAGNRLDPFKKCDLLYMGVNGTSYPFGCNIHVIGRWKEQE